MSDELKANGIADPNTTPTQGPGEPDPDCCSGPGDGDPGPPNG